MKSVKVNQDPVEIIYNIPELKSVFVSFYKSNKSNKVPYHNLWHSLCMVKYCNEGALFEGLNNSDRIDLLISALVHDMNHSGGCMSDEDNVRIAKEAGYKLYKNTNFFKDEEEFENRIGRIVNATQYPYVIPAKDLDKQQQIIRDADLIQSMENTWFTHTTCGLCSEMNVDIEDFFDMQLSFFEDIKMNTVWGKNRWSQNIPKHIAKVNMAKNMFLEQKEKDEEDLKEIGRDLIREKIKELNYKYPPNSYEENIDRIESLGFEVHASTSQCEVWRSPIKDDSDLVVHCGASEDYNTNLIFMFDQFYRFWKKNKEN